MKTSILSLALGVVLAGPVAAYANERPLGPVHSHPVHHWSIHRHRAVFAAPSSGAIAQVPHAATHWRDPFKPRTTNGLSSNIDACVSYGCVDAGSQ